MLITTIILFLLIGFLTYKLSLKYPDQKIRIAFLLGVNIPLIISSFWFFYFFLTCNQKLCLMLLLIVPIYFIVSAIIFYVISLFISYVICPIDLNRKKENKKSIIKYPLSVSLIYSLFFTFIINFRNILQQFSARGLQNIYLLDLFITFLIVTIIFFIVSLLISVLFSLIINSFLVYDEEVNPKLIKIFWFSFISLLIMSIFLISFALHFDLRTRYVYVIDTLALGSFFISGTIFLFYLFLKENKHSRNT